MTLSDGLSPTMVAHVLSGSIDLALAYNPPKDSRLVSEALLDEDLYLVGHPDLIGKSSSPVAFSDIPQGSVLGLNPVPASRAIIQAHILRNQIEPSPTLEIGSLIALRQALEKGLGCAILARSTVLAELEQKRFHARRIVQPALTRTLAIVSLADRPQTRAFVEVRNTVIDVVRTATKSGRWPTIQIRAARTLERDSVSSNRHHALTSCLSISFRKTGIHFSGSCSRAEEKHHARAATLWLQRAAGRELLQDHLHGDGK